jgi:hypothetical protein
MRLYNVESEMQYLNHLVWIHLKCSTHYPKSSLDSFPIHHI